MKFNSESGADVSTIEHKICSATMTFSCNAIVEQALPLDSEPNFFVSIPGFLNKAVISELLSSDA